MRWGKGGFSSKVKSGGGARPADRATRPRCAQPLLSFLRRKRVSPVAFQRRRSGAPRRLSVSSSLLPLKRKNIIAAIGPVPTMRTSPPSCAFTRSRRVHDARERIQERGRLVGKARRDSPEAVLHDALRDEEKVREGAEERPLERGRAEVLPARAAVVAASRRGRTPPRSRAPRARRALPSPPPRRRPRTRARA